MAPITDSQQPRLFPLPATHTQYELLGIRVGHQALAVNPLSSPIHKQCHGPLWALRAAVLPDFES